MNSTTETFVAMRLHHRQLALVGGGRSISALASACRSAGSEGSLSQFKDVPQVLFNMHPGRAAGANSPDAQGTARKKGCRCASRRNCLARRLRIYPVQMEFQLRIQFLGGASPEAYERLILDVMAGDATLFMRPRRRSKTAWENG